jgi:hypothetical protein
MNSHDMADGAQGLRTRGGTQSSEETTASLAKCYGGVAAHSRTHSVFYVACRSSDTCGVKCDAIDRREARRTTIRITLRGFVILRCRCSNVKQVSCLHCQDRTNTESCLSIVPILLTRSFRDPTSKFEGALKGARSSGSSTLPPAPFIESLTSARSHC